MGDDNSHCTVRLPGIWTEILELGTVELRSYFWLSDSKVFSIYRIAYILIENQTTASASQLES